MFFVRTHEWISVSDAFKRWKDVFGAVSQWRLRRPGRFDSAEAAVAGRGASWRPACWRPACWRPVCDAYQSRVAGHGQPEQMIAEGIGEDVGLPPTHLPHGWQP
jgi:hypothetical protein